MNRTQHSIQNSIWGCLDRVIHMVMPVLFRALIIRELSVAYVGFDGLFRSVLTVLNLTELGFGAAIIYMMYKPAAENDKKTFRQLLSLLRTVYRWVGLAVLALGILMIPFLRLLVKNDTGTDVNIYLLYSMYLFHTVMSYWLYSYKSSIFSAYQRSAVIFKILVGISIVQYSLQALSLLIFKNYYVYLAIFAVLIIPQNLLYHIVSKKEYPDLYCEGKATKEQISLLTGKIKALFGHKIGNSVLFSIDSIIISAFLGVSILAQYDNYNYILTAIVTFLGVLLTSMCASVGNKMALDSRESTYELFKRMAFLWVGVVGFCATCLMCLFQPFITIWVGAEFLFSETMVLWFAMYFFVWQFRLIGIVVKDAAGLWEVDKLKPYIGMTLNIVLSILCVKLTQSIVGVMAPTMLILLCIYFPWETYIIFTYYFKRSSKEYYLLMVRFLLTAIISGAVTYALCRLLPLQGILLLMCRGMICVLAMPAVYALLNGNTKQFHEAIGMLGGIKRKLMLKLGR